MKKLTYILVFAILIVGCKKLKVEEQFVVVEQGKISENLFGFDVSSTSHFGDSKPTEVGHILFDYNYNEVSRKQGVYSDETGKIQTSFSYSKDIYPNHQFERYHIYAQLFYIQLYFVENGKIVKGSQVEMRLTKRAKACISDSKLYLLNEDTTGSAFITRVVENSDEEDNLGSIANGDEFSWGSENMSFDEFGFYFFRSNNSQGSVYTVSYDEGTNKVGNFAFGYKVDYLQNVNSNGQSLSGRDKNHSFICFEGRKQSFPKHDGVCSKDANNVFYYDEGNPGGIWKMEVYKHDLAPGVDTYLGEFIGQSRNLFHYHIKRNTIVVDLDDDLVEMDVNTGQVSVLYQGMFDTRTLWGHNVYSDGGDLFIITEKNSSSENELYKLSDEGGQWINVESSKLEQAVDFISFNDKDYMLVESGLVEL
ncbi:MAG: hypothetical protein ACPGEG_00385 [Salibacteraceae bacterium]